MHKSGGKTRLPFTVPHCHRLHCPAGVCHHRAGCQAPGIMGLGPSSTHHVATPGGWGHQRPCPCGTARRAQAPESPSTALTEGITTHHQSLTSTPQQTPAPCLLMRLWRRLGGLGEFNNHNTVTHRQGELEHPTPGESTCLQPCTARHILHQPSQKQTTHILSLGATPAASWAALWRPIRQCHLWVSPHVCICPERIP